MANAIIAARGGDGVEPNGSVPRLGITLFLRELFGIFVVGMHLTRVKTGEPLRRHRYDHLIEILLGKGTFASLTAGQLLSDDNRSLVLPDEVTHYRLARPFRRTDYSSSGAGS